jgi:predicted exporter/lauroyl/myristoyl acyltransferase
MKHKKRWLLLLLAIPIAVGLARLKFDSEVLDLLPGNLPVVHGLKLYQQHFSNARDLVITLRAADAEHTEHAARVLAEHLRPLTNLVADVTWEPPWIENPGQVGELLGYLWLNQPPEYLRQLAERVAPGNISNTLANAREELSTTLSPEEIARLSYDPFGFTRLPEQTMNAAPAFGRGQEMFASPDGSFRILFTQSAHDLPTYRDAAKWLGEVRGQIDAALGNDTELHGISYGLTGPPAFVSEIAQGMEHDMTGSVGGTSIIIAILFWLAHRRWKPMLWLLILLALILGATLALGGLLFGKIYVVSIGFAAILLGLAVDYAVVHYQEALAHPDLSIPQIRRAIAPSIFWAAVTTISAFMVLNFGGLPGLAQLGSLVGLGVALSACVMIFAFLPPLFPGRMQPQPTAKPTPIAENPVSLSRRRVSVVIASTLGIVMLCLINLATGLPHIDPTANALRPRNSRSYAALEEIKRELNQNREPLWLIVAGRTEREVATRLREAQPALQNAVSNGTLAGFNLPLQLWPDPQQQSANRSTALELAADRARLHAAAKSGGFTESSLGLADQILDTWKNAASASSVFWPTNPMSRWIFQKVTARSANQFFALGFLNPPGNGSLSLAGISALEAELPHDRVWLSGWELLGSGIFGNVKRNLWKLIIPMVTLVLLSLWLAFQRWKEILLSIAVLVLSGICLLTTMHLAGWSWNLLNLMALPLILGTGVDYSIFIQLALRRYNGDLQRSHRSVGRALLLCGATAIAGFGSLAWSSNAGMASLGQICAVGIAGNMLISVILLPTWWHLLTERDANLHSNSEKNSIELSSPSSLYRAHFWRLGLWLVRVLPPEICIGFSRFLAGCYWHLASHRRQMVIENLRPALDGDPAAAIKKARSLFDQFAIKLVDLWRYEAGQPIQDLFGESTGWENFEKAHEQKRGVLLLTVHLGNWELGGPWLTARGFPLKIITLAEPGAGFTQLRQASRLRWNVETLVIGDDPFGFLEVIRRLEAGETVALLIDRPPAATTVEVELFGLPFPASVAAAELARASGCELVPVYLPRMKNSYAAHILPPILYDRAGLRDRIARQQLTGQIMRAFEPAIRQNLDQWFHFIRIWPR